MQRQFQDQSSELEDKNNQYEKLDMIKEDLQKQI